MYAPKQKKPSTCGNPRSEKSDFQLAFREVDSAVESREHARGTARVVAFVPKRTRAPRATPHRETRGGPRRDEIPSRPGRSRCRDSAMGLDLGVTGRAAVGSAGPPRATTKAVHPLRPSGGRLSICGQFVIDAKGAWTPVSKDAERTQPTAMHTNESGTARGAVADRQRVGGGERRP